MSTREASNGWRFEFFLDLPGVAIRTSSPPDSVKGVTGAPAAVRVLRRLCRLRRDPLPQAADPALRRPDARGQRHRLLVDLRRQPADDAVVHGRRRAGSGLGQLPLRGQRRVRPRVCASASTSTTARPAAWSSASPRPRRRPGRASCWRPTGPRRGGDRSPAATGWHQLQERLADVDGSASRPPSRLADDLVRPQRLDRRRRRLGLRHRLRWGRPRPGQRPQRQPPRPRHRGVLQHRRPGLQGDAPGRGGQVRLRRAGGPARRIWATTAGPTATSTSPRWPWAPATSRR